MGVVLRDWNSCKEEVCLRNKKYEQNKPSVCYNSAEFMKTIYCGSPHREFHYKNRHLLFYYSQ